MDIRVLFVRLMYGIKLISVAFVRVISKKRLKLESEAMYTNKFSSGSLGLSNQIITISRKMMVATFNLPGSKQRNLNYRQIPELLMVHLLLSFLVSIALL